MEKQRMKAEQMYDWYIENWDPHWVNHEYWNVGFRRFDHWPPLAIEEVNVFTGEIGLYEGKTIIHHENSLPRRKRK